METRVVRKSVGGRPSCGFESHIRYFEALALLAVVPRLLGFVGFVLPAREAVLFRRVINLRALVIVGWLADVCLGAHQRPHLFVDWATLNRF